MMLHAKFNKNCCADFRGGIVKPRQAWFLGPIKVLKRFFESNFLDEDLTRLRGYLLELMSRPEISVAGGVERKKQSDPDDSGPTRYEFRIAAGADAYRNNFMTALDLALFEINRILKTDLQGKFASKKLWEYRTVKGGPPDSVFPVEKNGKKSQIGWITSGRKVIDNPDFKEHIKQGRGFIRTPWGQFLVIGNLPPKPKSRRGNRYWAWVIADALTSGRFTKFRCCVECRRVFVAADIRKSTCTDCGDLYNYERAAKSRGSRLARDLGS